MKMKRSMTTFLILLLVSSTTGILSLFLIKNAAAYIQYPTVSVLPSESIAEVGQSLTVSIYVDYLEGVRSWSLQLDFDGAILYTKKEMVQLGDFFTKNGFGLDKQDNVTVVGANSIASTNMLKTTDWVDSDGTLLLITFNVIDTGKVKLHLHDVYFKDKDNQLIAGPDQVIEVDGLFYTRTPHASFYYLPSRAAVADYTIPTALQRDPIINEPITFNASAFLLGGRYKGSYDSDGSITSYSWSFGDGNITTVTVPVIIHTYTQNKTYGVNLTVTDNEGKKDWDAKPDVLVLKHDVAITSIDVSPTAASPGEKVSIKVTIKNLGSTSEFVNVTLYYRNDTKDTLIWYNQTENKPAFSNAREKDPVTGLPPLPFLMGNSIIINYTLPGLTEGEYTIWANISLTDEGGKKFLKDKYQKELDNNPLDNSLTWDRKLKIIPLHNVKIKDIKLSPTLPATVDNPIFIKYSTEVSVSVTVSNTGDFNETFYVTLYQDSTLLYNWTSIELTKKSSKVLEPTFMWNTALLPSPVDKPLNYTIKAVASNVTGEVELDRTTDNTLKLNVTTTFPPTASFTYTPTNPVTNKEVSFDATPSTPSLGQQIVKYEWEVYRIVDTMRVADVTLEPKDSKTPKRAFTVSGTREVNLTITDSWGLTNSTAQLIYVGDAPTADFTYSPAHPQTNVEVTFNATVSYDPDDKIVSYDWVFGDGQTGTGNITAHAYIALGAYNVTLTVTDERNHKGTKSQIVTVVGTPVANFTFSPTKPVVDQKVSFDASSSQPNGGSITSYSWDFGDGSTITTSEATIDHFYRKGGDFSATLTVFDSEGLNNSVTKTITVAKLDSSISIAGSPLTLIIGQITTINGQISPTRANVKVKIEYRKQGSTTWSSLSNVTTDTTGRYLFDWKPTATGTYEIRAVWDGDEKYKGDESEPLEITVLESSSPVPPNLFLYTVGAIVGLIIIGLAIFLVRRRKVTKPIPQ